MFQSKLNFLCHCCPNLWYFQASKPWKYQFSLRKINVFQVFEKSMFVRFWCIFPSKNHPKTLPKRGPNPSKIESKNDLLFNIDVLGFRPRFWNPWASTLELSWPSWSPRTLPKACKIQSFAQGASQEAPKSLPRDPRTQFWNSWSLMRTSDGFRWAPICQDHHFARIPNLMTPEPETRHQKGGGRCFC